ncbi:MAG: DUF1549 domain-containing protein [Planctomycetota bacterium]
MRHRRIARLFAFGAPALLLALVVWPSPADAEPGVSDRLHKKRAAAKIDSLVEAALREGGMKANGIADDATFARRTYLALVGRIPTAQEARAFQKSTSSDKYLDLVDDLLASKGHESHMYNWWADLLRARGRLPRRISGEPYIHWIKDSIAKNKPYDAMVREMLAAKGPVHERGNGATGYLMRDRNMPEDNMSNTIRLFLGSRVECAQCHNHPFDKWTQKQYFQMVAFTGGISYQQNPRQNPKIRSLGQEANKRWGRNGSRALRRTLEPSFTGIFGSGTGAARLPSDYQYDDAKPDEWVTAEPMFNPHVSVSIRLPNESRIRKRMKKNPKRMERALRRLRPGEVDSRGTFADWVTSASNDRFSKVIANRLWKKMFGRGLIEPVDDIKDRTAAVAPELMENVRALMVELDFDVREFQRVLLYSRLWRRQAVSPADTPGSLADLRGPVLRRMTAEQVWDSLLTLVVEDLDETIQDPLGPRADAVYTRFDTMAKATDEEILEQTERLVLRYTNPDEYRKQQRAERSKRQDDMRQKRRDNRDLFRALKRAQRDGNREKESEILKQLQDLGVVPPGFRAGRALRDLQRAADLQSPSPDGHLLRELGQSERELIEASHTEPTVPQVLALLNSFLEQRLLTNRNAVLSRSLAKQRGAKNIVREAFTAVLGRAPTSQERAEWTREVGSDGAKATQDLVWTLVNSHEFLFIQ